MSGPKEKKDERSFFEPEDPWEDYEWDEEEGCYYMETPFGEICIYAYPPDDWEEDDG